MDAVTEIKQRLRLEEYVARGLKLTRVGRNYRGLCPFHTEKTPSFYVFPERGTWRCFGSCGEGGDIFTFVQKREACDFREALRNLAQEAGVELSPQAAQKRSRVEHLGAIVSAAVEYYQRQLAAGGGEEARAYLTGRGIQPDAIDAFRLGWAPNDWRALHDHLTARGYHERDILAAGLLVEGERGGQPYDRFRGRLTIPIADERGIFVGMGGRGLASEEPKYLNTPQSELFDKGRTLYGLDLAGEAIRAAGLAVVVEGYMDVIGPWQAGFRNVVATMGTSLTEQQAAVLKRYARRLVLAMDPDAAGAAAAERAGALFLGLDSPEAMGRSARSADLLSTGAELDLRVAPLPAGKDPDRLSREDPEGWRSGVTNALPYMEFLLRRAMGQGRPESSLEGRRLVDRLRPILLAVSDPLERSVYIQRVGRHLGVSEAAVMDRLRLGLAPGRSRPQRQAPPRADSPTREETLLAIFFRHPHLRFEVRGWPVDILSGALEREVFGRWLASEDLVSAESDDPVVAYARRLEGFRLPPMSADESRRAIDQVKHEILRDRLLQRQAALTEDLAAAEKSLGPDRVATVANDVWRGGMPRDEDYSLAETVIEELELGLSLHRREG